MTEDEKLALDPNAIVRSITVQIDAPAQVVWDVLVDFDRYRDWNPTKSARNKFCFVSEALA